MKINLVVVKAIQFIHDFSRPLSCQMQSSAISVMMHQSSCNDVAMFKYKISSNRKYKPLAWGVHQHINCQLHGMILTTTLSLLRAICQDPRAHPCKSIGQLCNCRLWHHSLVLWCYLQTNLDVLPILYAIGQAKTRSKMSNHLAAIIWLHTWSIKLHSAYAACTVAVEAIEPSSMPKQDQWLQ